MRRRKYYDDYSSSDDEHRRKKTKRGDGTEAARVRKRLANFDSERCIAWIEIQKRFGSGITHSELKSIAQVICEHQREPHLKLDRDASRDNRVLLKWFTENWSIIEPHLKILHYAILKRES
ncbi:hypothetical protein TVAG_359410 [Trichomonas vaginalis G3]|uniref:Uncharacterized protein n=1 Tax=Trichomonas vaginalis (strain ATCC PRA-98 / G3) TaxID=412133 RepID=A2DT61_TRIV3|nr:hypothetical protein TVAGG3_0968810 [Trichomonas vaginalis G3]EAY16333.1 hypothetical protein TVAG_359410 [Trichomonas vaginalis G3]KAI5488441.1 hypothetical protein TVAGG3_0968810 [Trichomonas vaginalis G3]|eukprot:XP_001328556.1 hypothetical protein [Trichomonas vaginalis G3]